jgi:hypothetical protein
MNDCEHLLGNAASKPVPKMRNSKPNSPSLAVLLFELSHGGVAVTLDAEEVSFPEFKVKIHFLFSRFGLFCVLIVVRYHCRAF